MRPAVELKADFAIAKAGKILKLCGNFMVAPIKYPDPLKKVPEMPETIIRKVRRPPMVAVVNDSCTGCQNCVPFCPVDCIEPTPPNEMKPDGHPIPPVRIRYNECIGCQICVNVCDQIWDAIDMWPTADVEKEFGIKIS